MRIRFINYRRILNGLEPSTDVIKLTTSFVVKKKKKTPKVQTLLPDKFAICLWQVLKSFTTALHDLNV